jgi:hypothetical protein
LIGSARNLTYNYTHLGNSAKTLEDLCNGHHPFYEKLEKAEFPMILIGAETLQRSDAESIMNIINMMANNTNLINKKE